MGTLEGMSYSKLSWLYVLVQGLPSSAPSNGALSCRRTCNAMTHGGDIGLDLACRSSSAESFAICQCCIRSRLLRTVGSNSRSGFIRVVGPWTWCIFHLRLSFVARDRDASFALIECFISAWTWSGCLAMISSFFSSDFPSKGNFPSVIRFVGSWTWLRAPIKVGSLSLSDFGS